MAFISHTDLCNNRVFVSIFSSNKLPQNEEDTLLEKAANSSQGQLTHVVGLFILLLCVMKHLPLCPPDALQQFWRNIPSLESLELQPQ